MANPIYELLVRARDHFRIAHHHPGRIRLRFNPKVLTSVPELSSKSERNKLTSIPGISEIETNPLSFSLTIHYDPELITPDAWHTVISGSEEEARAVLEEVCRVDNE